jgi:Methyltransferase domain
MQSTQRITTAETPSLDPDILLQKLCADPPKLHRHPTGMLISTWRPDETTIVELQRRLRPGMKTIETGAGFTTIMFAIYGCEHTCIAPDRELLDRIRAYCDEHGISTKALTFVDAMSVDVVPQLSAAAYDLALIDGCHGFPTVYVDFLYLSRALKTGGTMVVDDLDIFTCQTVARFMQSDVAWRTEVCTGRVAFGVKLDETGSVFREWHIQPFVRGRSTATSWKARLGSILGFY